VIACNESKKHFLLCVCLPILKALGTKLRWGAFVKVLGGTTMVTVLVVARFTFVQVDYAILGPTPTSFNIGPYIHYFITTCR
jgi:hypothetical protein